MLTVDQAVTGYFGGMVSYPGETDRTKQARAAAQDETDKVLAGLDPGRQGDLEPPPSEHVQQQEPHRTRRSPRPRRWRPHRLSAFSARLARGRNGVIIATGQRH